TPRRRKRRTVLPEVVHLIGIMNGLFMLKNFLLDESGQSVVEYTLLLTLIGATTVFMLTLMGLSVSQMIGVQVTWDRYTQWAYEKFSTK
ncbi:MAG: Flp family type IVb pilin, partial [Blastocatellia bacterium]